MRRKQKKNIRGRGEGSVTFDEVKGLWQASIQVGLDQNGRPKRTYVYSKKKQNVLEKLLKAQTERAAGIITTSERITVAEFLENHLATVKNSGNTTGTYHNYAGFVKNHINPIIGGYRLRAIEPLHLQHLQMTMIEKGASLELRRKIHVFLSSVFKSARKLKILGVNPCDDIDAPKVKDKEMLYWDDDEAQRFLKASVSHRLHAMFVLALSLGLRQGELLGLKWCDVNLKVAQPFLKIDRTLDYHGNKLIVKEPKTKHSRRTILLTPLAVVALKNHQKLMMAEGHRASEWVFCNSIGTPYHRVNVVRRCFEPLIEKAGVKRIRFHDLRHTAATLMLSRGVNIEVVSKILGHKNSAITSQVYAHVLKSMQEQAVVAMDGLFPALKRHV